ncbi:RNA polymerase sigma factor [Pikeienuella sp. HZG-20]|uniref:RNA polymerase sigma factor n=1 Tax=Paludibacillus litoralis TaxID=3133267 RepID=UPI0030EC30A3
MMKVERLADYRSLDGLPEERLVALARERDEMAVRALIQRCNQQMFRVARGIVHSDSEAEDVVQAAYVSAFTKLEKFRGDAAFSTWLTRIVMNEAYGRLRRRKLVVNLDDYREGAMSELEEAMSHSTTPPPSSAETEVGRAEFRRILEEAVDSLPEPFRLAYILRDVQEMSAKEVAALLGVKVVTIKTRLFRARRLLRGKLEKTAAREFTGIFPFDGERCVGMTDRVLNSLFNQVKGGDAS